MVMGLDLQKALIQELAREIAKEEKRTPVKKKPAKRKKVK
jgi:hypothetical protein